MVIVDRIVVGGGFTGDINELKKQEKEKLENSLPLPELNEKKIRAIYATKEDGNRLFSQEIPNIQLAAQVYERGIMIINGLYGISDEKWSEISKIECSLYLNLAACYLKLKEPFKTIDYCNQALKIDKTQKKAYYRIGQAYMEMGKYKEAIVEFKKMNNSSNLVQSKIKKAEELIIKSNIVSQKNDLKLAEKALSNDIFSS